MQVCSAVGERLGKKGKEGGPAPGVCRVGARQLDREDHYGVLFKFLGGRLDQDL